MKNFEVSRVLNEIADLTEIIGEEAFKARAYRRASESIAKLPGDIRDFARDGRLMEIPGVGKNIAAKIEEYLATGTVRHLEKLREKAPHTILELLEVPGLGPRTASVLLKDLNIRDLAGLEAALSQGRLKGLTGIGEKKEQALKKGVEQVRRRGTRKPLGFMWPVSEQIADALRGVGGVERVDVAGSIRRRCETIGDIDLVASTTDPAGLIELFTSLPGVTEIVASGDTKASVKMEDIGQVDLLAVAPAQFVTALHHFTGSKEHNVRMRGMAKDRGLKINEYGIFDEEERPRGVSSEADIYRIFDMDYIPPELREDTGEAEAALEHRLPDLVEAGDIKGDLHVHTRWTDGTASIMEMAQAARGLGHEYVAISDHSKSLGVAGGLDEEELARQAEEISEVNARLDGFRVLAGIEVDIARSGDLDLDDKTLSGLDIVTASVHSAFHMDEEAMTARIEKAMKSPHVDVIGHPTGRLIGRREPYQVNVGRLIDMAAKTGTFLEINASPDRLDLSDYWARQAIKAGCRLVINTDAHATTCLHDTRYGVAVARRAWATRHDILNTLPVDDLLEAIR
ncbi:MAG: DNA polymerase/3'-5' exonuclease PolX [Firmicutes bacterium]|nr:DNA polymerase/3'-5' exonuclease PolX [Bacillota bacterium]